MDATSRLTARAELPAAELHASIGDDVLGSVTFLNEVAAAHPDAVSFAAGAAHEDAFAEVDVGGLVDEYAAHLADRHGMDDRAVRRTLFQYGPARGHIGELIAEGLRRDLGIDVAAAAIVVTVGCQEAMLVALRALCRGPGDLVAAVDPCYPGLRGAARLLDVDLLPVADSGATVDLAGLRAACREARASGGRVRALYVAPDFANPSGTLLDLETRRSLLALAEEEDLYLLEDGVYGFTAAAPHRLPSLKALDATGRVIHLGSFAKIGAPGARVGYLVADRRVRSGSGARLLADDLAAVKSMVTNHTSPISQAVVAGMLLRHGGSLSALGRAKAHRYRRNLRLLLDALEHAAAVRGERFPEVTWNRPDGGFFVRLRLPIPVTDGLLEVSAREFGVLWTPMRHFYIGTGGEHELRLACSNLDERRLRIGVDRLCDFLEAVCPPPRSRRADREASACG
ncbi:MAG TPA: PLP-dependent aminotransferase family protein [Glycomyces sp.]|nr:PLP-dependent aminotransferase family protein [Glycomyces sp.]